MAKKRNMGARIYPAHKPKEGVKWVLYWDDLADVWALIHATSLESGDIWRPELAAPSNRLLKRANQCAEDREAQLEG